MNKKYFLFLFLILSGLQITAQSNFFKDIEQGVVFSSRLDSDEDFKFQIKGFGIEAGYYFLKKTRRKSSISLDIRLAYAQSERYVKALNADFDFFFISDSLITQREGIVKYKNLSPLPFQLNLGINFLKTSHYLVLLE